MYIPCNCNCSIVFCLVRRSPLFPTCHDQHDKKVEGGGAGHRLRRWAAERSGTGTYGSLRRGGQTPEQTGTSQTLGYRDHSKQTFRMGEIEYKQDKFARYEVSDTLLKQNTFTKKIWCLQVPVGI